MLFTICKELNMKRFGTGALLLVLLSLIAIALTGCGAKSETTLKAKVAEAALNSQRYLDSEVRAYRSRQSTVQTVEMRDLRDLRRITDQEVHFEVNFEIQPPARVRMVWEDYRVYPDEPGKRYSSSECASVSIAIGTATYSQGCDGTWSKGDPIEKPLAFDPSADAKAFKALTELSTVSKAPSEILRGVAVDVYEGSYVDAGQKRDAIVKIGRDNGLVLYFRATAPGFFWEIERWDFNAPDIVVEPPLPN